jgi:hypothetical protein
VLVVLIVVEASGLLVVEATVAWWRWLTSCGAGACAGDCGGGHGGGGVVRRPVGWIMGQLHRCISLFFLLFFSVHVKKCTAKICFLSWNLLFFMRRKERTTKRFTVCVIKGA